MNYYEVLQVSPAASHEVIRMAYQALQNHYHIESLQGDKKYAELKMQQLDEAYRILSSPILRQQYDRMLQTQNEQTSLNEQVLLQQGHSSVQKKKQTATKGKVLLMAAICILLMGALVAVLGFGKGTQEKAEPWIKNQFVTEWLKNPETGEEIKKNQVLSVTFVGTLADAPENSWDISSLKKRSVLAWAIPNGNCYDVYIAAEGGVNADGHCEGMFEGFRKLERVSFNGAFHTKDVKQMSRMFKDCSSLPVVSLAGLDTSDVTDMSEMFSGCHKLTTLDLSGLKTANVTNMSGMFKKCFELETIDLSRIDTACVTDMNSMFNACRSVTVLKLDNFDTSNVSDMSKMFYDCQNLQTLDISRFDTTEVTDISGMFEQCDQLVSLDLTNFDTSNVINMHKLFGGCVNLAELDVKNFNTSKVLDMSYMFFACHSLAELDISNFDTSNVKNMDMMFSQCHNMKEVNFGRFDTSKVESYICFANDDSIGGVMWQVLFEQ